MGASLDAPFRKGHRGTNNFYAIPPYLCLCDFFVGQMKIVDSSDKVNWRHGQMGIWFSSHSRMPSMAYSEEILLIHPPSESFCKI